PRPPPGPVETNVSEEAAGSVSVEGGPAACRPASTRAGSVLPTTEPGRAEPVVRGGPAEGAAVDAGHRPVAVASAVDAALPAESLSTARSAAPRTADLARASRSHGSPAPRTSTSELLSRTSDPTGSTIR